MKIFYNKHRFFILCYTSPDMSFDLYLFLQNSAHLDLILLLLVHYLKSGYERGKKICLTIADTSFKNLF